MAKQQQNNDQIWMNNLSKLFGNKKIVIKNFEDGWDQFIGKLRKLEDGEDPFSKERMDKNEEALLSISRGMYGIAFRDKRDEELYRLWNIGMLNYPPSERFISNLKLD